MNPWASTVTPQPNMPRQRVVDPDAGDSERSYSVVSHLSLLAMHFTVIPVLGPILWLIRRHDSPFLDDHGREAVNFQISIMIYMFISTILLIVGVGVITMIASYVLGIVGCIMGAVAAHRGEFFRYPMSIRLIG